MDWLGLRPLRNSFDHDSKVRILELNRWKSPSACGRLAVGDKYGCKSATFEFDPTDSTCVLGMRYHVANSLSDRLEAALGGSRQILRFEIANGIALFRNLFDRVGLRTLELRSQADRRIPCRDLSKLSPFHRTLGELDIARR